MPKTYVPKRIDRQREALPTAREQLLFALVSLPDGPCRLRPAHRVDRRPNQLARSMPRSLGLASAPIYPACRPLMTKFHRWLGWWSLPNKMRWPISPHTS